MTNPWKTIDHACAILPLLHLVPEDPVSGPGHLPGHHGEILDCLKIEKRINNDQCQVNDQGEDYYETKPEVEFEPEVDDCNIDGEDKLLHKGVNAVGPSVHDP